MVFRSRFAEPSIPDRELSEFVLGGVDAYPERPAVIDAANGGRLTYGQLRAQVDRFAAALRDLGIGKGDVVAIQLPNLPEYPVVSLATTGAGATSTTLNPAYTSHEIAAQLADAGARLVVTIPECLDKVRAAIRPGVRLVVVGERSGEAIDYADLLRAAAPAATADVDPGEDLATLPYSSGTTGLTKGVMLTHRSLVANGVQCAPFFTTEEDVALAVAPFFHIMGMAVILVGGVWPGAKPVSQARLALEAWLRA